MVDKKIVFPLCGSDIGLEKVSPVFFNSGHIKSIHPFMFNCIKTLNQNACNKAFMN